MISSVSIFSGKLLDKSFKRCVRAKLYRHAPSPDGDVLFLRWIFSRNGGATWVFGGHGHERDTI